MNSNSVGGGKSEGGSEFIPGLKKGPWTAAEDKILLEYVRTHGEGNWNAVQKNTSLMRCGKSCRLRWVNHLKPNLKKGCFTPEEESNIIDLHSKIGNKWARIAAQLPGRTDNEIKNYWNTRLKRRQRAGLPVYPQDVQPEAAVFHLQQQFLLENHQNSTYSSSLSSFLPPPHSFYPNPTTQFNAAFSMPLSPVSDPFVTASSPTMFNHNLYSQPLPNPSSSFGFSSPLFGAPNEHSGGTQATKTELASIQTPPHTRSSTSSGCSHNDGVLGDDDKYQFIWPFTRRNSGLLDDLVQESSKLFGNKTSIGETSSDDFSSSQSSSINNGIKQMNMEDDLMSFLNNSDQMPELYTERSNIQGSEFKFQGVEGSPESELDWTLGSICRNKISGSMC